MVARSRSKNWSVNDGQRADLHRRGAGMSDRDFEGGGDGDGYTQEKSDDANASRPNTAKLRSG